MFGAIKLLGDQSPRPGQNSVGLGARDIPERFTAKALSDFGQGDPFRAERRSRAGNLVLKIRFSAAKYSFRNKSSCLTEPLT